MARLQWPNDYCLEVEFLRPHRELINTLAERIVTEGLRLIPEGGGEFHLETLRACVRHRNQPFKCRSIVGAFITPLSEFRYMRFPLWIQRTHPFVLSAAM